MKAVTLATPPNLVSPSSAAVVASGSSAAVVASGSSALSSTVVPATVVAMSSVAISATVVAISATVVAISATVVAISVAVSGTSAPPSSAIAEAKINNTFASIFVYKRQNNTINKYG